MSPDFLFFLLRESACTRRERVLDGHAAAHESGRSFIVRPSELTSSRGLVRARVGV